MRAVVKKMGVRYSLGYTRPSQWGKGKIHCMVWDPLNKTWRPWCSRPHRYAILDYPPCGNEEPCKKCLPTLQDAGLATIPKEP